MNQENIPDADSAAVAVSPQRDSRLYFPVGMLAIFALVAALYLARGFFVPLLIGALASYALHPLVDRLESLHFPRSFGAAIVMATVIGSMSWIAYSVSDDAQALIEKLPEAARNLRKNMSTARSGTPTALQNVQEAAHELQVAAAEAGAKPVTTARPLARVIAAPASESNWLFDYTLAQTALLATVAAQAPIVLLLTYFLLASGAHFRRKLIQLVGPSMSRRKEAIHILEEIDIQVQRYLLAMLVTNAMIAVATWLAFRALGVNEAGIWGIAAGILHFVPYLGPGLIVLGSAMAAYLQFDSLSHALLTAGVSLTISGLIGLTFMTWLQSKFARVNAAVLFIALLFFGWMWGVAGLLLGAPLVAIAKVVFDRVESLKPLGELLGQ